MYMCTYSTAASCFTVITDPSIAEKVYKIFICGTFYMSKLEGVKEKLDCTGMMGWQFSPKN